VTNRALQGQDLSCGDAVTGTLTEDDDAGFRGERFYQDEYSLEASEDDFVTVAMSAIPAGDDTGAAAVELDDGETGTNETDATEAVENGTADADTGPADEPQPEIDGDPYLYLLAPDGTVIAEDDDSGDNLNSFITVPRLPETGTYTIIATSFDEAATFEYELAVECGEPFETEPLACNDSVTGELTPDDATGFVSDEHAHDSYSFEGTAGEYVDISMDGFEAPIGDEHRDPADPLLVLLGPDFEFLAEDDDGGGGLNARITARLPADGEYTIIATSWAPQLYFGYSLSLSCREALEPEPIECGETISAELTPEDDTGIRTDFGQHHHDAYTFEGTAGTSVTILMQAERGYDDGGYPIGDPYLYLVNADGEIVAEDDDCGGDFGALIQHRLSTDGEYTIIATSFDAMEFFAYELTLGCEDSDTPLPEPESIECGDTVAAELSPTDSTGFRSPRHFHDVYEYEASGDEVLTVSMAASDGDCYLYLLDPDGNVIAEDDDGGGFTDSLIRGIQLDAEGTHYIVATSFNEGEVFEYGLSLQCEGDVIEEADASDADDDAENSESEAEESEEDSETEAEESE
jgi:hypothetical protein